jgi:hypothetical protein
VSIAIRIVHEAEDHAWEGHAPFFAFIAKLRMRLCENRNTGSRFSSYLYLVKPNANGVPG